MLLQTVSFTWTTDSRNPGQELNAWLDNNRDVKVHDIKYSTCVDKDSLFENALVIYEIEEEKD
jgi:hypothetical protein